MSNSLFENPKVALGFAGVVLAVALVASVAFQEFSPGEEPGLENTVVEQGSAAPARPTAAQQSTSGFASSQSSGWADQGQFSDDWGLADNAPTSERFVASDVPEGGNNAPIFGDRASGTASGSRPQRTSGPKVTSRAAPGAPPLNPPGAGPVPELTAVGN
ncbi:MAG: hypothetical protein AAGI28_02790 [Pseudomonadota bacterium]